MVLLPNGPSRKDDFLRACREGYADGWTARKAGAIGDVYLFYFAKPIEAILGIGVAASDAWDEEGPFDWTTKEYDWFREYEPLVSLDRPLTVAHLKNNRSLREWWNDQKPYRGRKGISDARIQHRLCSMIIEQNPEHQYILRDHLNEDTVGSDTNSVPEPVALPNIADDREEFPSRSIVTTSRIIRNTATADALKRLYRFKCQFCGIRIETRNGLYAEVHHLQPLGGVHRGPDSWGNMVVVCPTCHAKLDLLSMAIEPQSRRVAILRQSSLGRELKCRSGHKLSAECLAYQWSAFRG